MLSLPLIALLDTFLEMLSSIITMNKLNLTNLQHLGKSHDSKHSIVMKSRGFIDLYIGKDDRGRQYKIWIPEALSKYRENLLVNQMHVIEAGGTELDEVTEVKGHNHVQILGFLVEDPKMACIAMKFSQKDDKWYNHFVMSYLFREGTCIAGVVLVSPGVCQEIPVGTYDSRLSGLDDLYYPILEW
jgi:hypothetical protein